MAESNLRTTAQSWAGARGVMQLMPATYQEIRSKNPEITGTWDHPEWNIAAGIAYSRQLWTAWTNDSIVDDLREFMLSSYNAGRLTLRRAQKVAEERQLNPRAWPNIATVAPNVPRWRHSETLTYVSRVLGNLAGMDSQGRLTARPSAEPYHQAAGKPRRHHHVVARGDDHAFDAGQPLDERHALLGSEDEHARRQRVGEHRARRDDRDAASALRGLAEIGIDDVVIATAVLHEEPLVVARRAERRIGQIDRREAAVGRAARILDAERATDARRVGRRRRDRRRTES